MKKVLVLLSEYGYWGEELVGPLEILDEKGYEVVFATPTGARPRALPVSMEAGFIDPPLGRSVTGDYYADLTKEVDESDRLENPIDISAWFPERPYFSAENYLRDLEVYNDTLDEAKKSIDEYDALLIVGGSGPIVDLVNNQRVHDIILAFHEQDKLIAAECYGVTCLAFARDWYDRKSIIWGKQVTGHPLEYDYKDGTGFFDAKKGDWVDFNMGPPPYPLEYILRDATGPEGGYHSGVGRKVSALLDYPFVTSRSTASSRRCGELMIAALEDGVKRAGW